MGRGPSSEWLRCLVHYNRLHSRRPGRQAEKTDHDQRRFFGHSGGCPAASFERTAAGAKIANVGVGSTEQGWGIVLVLVLVLGVRDGRYWTRGGNAPPLAPEDEDEDEHEGRWEAIRSSAHDLRNFTICENSSCQPGRLVALFRPFFQERTLWHTQFLKLAANNTAPRRVT